MVSSNRRPANGGGRFATFDGLIYFLRKKRIIAAGVAAAGLAVGVHNAGETQARIDEHARQMRQSIEALRQEVQGVRDVLQERLAPEMRQRPATRNDGRIMFGGLVPTKRVG